MILGDLPSIMATAEFVVPFRIVSIAPVYSLSRTDDLPRSIPMTAPFTFSEPSVDSHLLKVVEGTLKALERAKEDATRGTFSTLVLELHRVRGAQNNSPRGRTEKRAL